jgi:hypothetical protein
MPPPSRLLVFLPIALLLTSCSREQEAFTPLFNGQDLTGWVNVNGAPSTWHVRDSMIVCSGIPSGVLRTTRHYENFVLELEWRHMKPGGNAGLFVYSDPIPVRGQPFTRAVEAQVMDGNHGDVFAIQGATMVPDRPHPEGWMRSLPTEARSRPAGEWNHYRLESRDGTVTLAVNGKIVSGGSRSIPRKGYIALESEGSEVHFRKLRIRELPGSTPPASEVADLDQGFVSLYSGVDLDGWRAGPEQAVRWNAADWQLALETAGTPASGPLWSEETYRSFEWIVDWRFTDDAGEAAASGLLVRGSYEPVVRLSPRAVSVGEAAIDDLVPGEWNRTQVALRGDSLRVWINGRPVVAEVLLQKLPAEGPVGLLDAGAALSFANLYIKP